MQKEYYLGLDMGTASVGWAVTDTSYRLLRAKGKDLWGIRLFDEANTSAARRTQRVARRRRAREKARINYLRLIFSEAINKVDPAFFQRLEESKYHLSDKSTTGKYALFSDPDFTDKDYFNKYPTIFHLRKELAESDESHDVRLVYLALLNMFKHRGHFLNEGLADEQIADLSDIWSRLSELSENWPTMDDEETLRQTLTNSSLSRKDRKAELIYLLHVDKKDAVAEMLAAVCGLTVSISKLFPDSGNPDDAEIKKISFLMADYEEKEAVLLEQLDEESFELFSTLKQLHDWRLLAGILQKHETLSHARVMSYEKHRKDLLILKKLLKRCNPELYHEMFRIMQDNNYSAYVGSVNHKSTKQRRGTKRTPDLAEKFFSRLEKTVSALPQDKDTEYILNEIRAETLLPLQLVATNGVIPNQIHVSEMKMILRNAESYLPFLIEKDASGLTNSEKIIALFRFHIPYYVGPLSNTPDNRAWSVRLEPGKVFPWNLEQKIDLKKTHEAFIQNLLKDDTYLRGTYVLPKNSLLYEKYMVLNELNNLRIEGGLSVPLKQQIYHDLFRKGKRVTGKQLKDYLKRNGLVSTDSDPVITGIDQDFTNTLTNYARFCSVFGVDQLTYEQTKIAEDIIYYATIYGDAKKVLKDLLQEKFGKKLTDQQIRRITGFRFRDWGRLSKDLLTLEGADKETGEIKTIISRLWDENVNLMQLLSRDYTYTDEIAARTDTARKTLSEITCDDLNGFYLSAPVRRMTWQSLKIIKEICDVMGGAPKRIFIETARETNTVKQRTQSRQKKLTDLYKAIGAEGKEWVKELQETDAGRFRSKKLYLYYTQMGKCMYTGEMIDLADLFNDNLYDIDHIYPRHFVKDDSLENNLVLVKQAKNRRKSDVYPIESSIRTKMSSFWKSLLERGFITKEKYQRLIRTTGFSAEERAGFISRQLVETRQGTKTLTGILETVFPDTEIIYSKAGNVSDFRHQFSFIKCRDVNDFHHANDAYLNIVVGNVYFVKFTKDPRRFIAEYDKDKEKNNYHMDKIFEYPVRRGEDVAWITENDESIRTVKSVMRKTSPLISMRSYEAHGGLADQTIYKAVDANKVNGVGYLPIKSSDIKLHDTSRYGGFRKYLGTYFFLVEHTLKDKRVRTIENLPLYLNGSHIDKTWLTSYCTEYLELDSPSVRFNKIKMYSKLRVNGFDLYLTGRSNDSLFVSNAIPLKLESSMMTYVKRLLERLEQKRLTENDPYITTDDNQKLYDILLKKHTENIFRKRPNPIGEVLKDGADEFAELDIVKQAYVLKQILQISQLSNTGADLQAIGGKKTSGVSTLNKKISSLKSCLLIETSVTGLYQREIDLLSI